MKKVLKDKLKKKVQKIFRIYPCNIFVINGMNEFKIVEPKVKCGFIPITLDNCHRVSDFREEARIAEYRDKLARNEIGYFAEHNGKMIGSIWATINRTEVPRVVQTFQKVMYNEGVAHDIVISENFRGMRVGPFIESNLFALLFKEYGLSRVITDVNMRNHAQMQLLTKLGLRVDHKMLYVSLLGRPVLEVSCKKYAKGCSP